MLFFIIYTISLLLLVGLSTVFERKFLGLFHIRLGFQNFGPGSLLVFLADFIKFAFKKCPFVPSLSIVYFVIIPWIKVILAVVLFNLSYRYFGWYYSFKVLHWLWFWLMLAILLELSFFVYIFIFNNTYSLISTLRGLVFYYVLELCLVLLVLVAFLLFNYLSFTASIWSLWLLAFPYYLLWFILLLFSAQRLPFDCIESESELIAGHDLEYGGPLFLAIFLFQYLSLAFIITIWVLTLNGGFNTFLVLFSYGVFMFSRVLLLRYNVGILFNIWVNWLLGLMLVAFLGYYYFSL